MKHGSDTFIYLLKVKPQFSVGEIETDIFNAINNTLGSHSNPEIGYFYILETYLLCIPVSTKIYTNNLPHFCS